jgi:hypothetical protein
VDASGWVVSSSHTVAGQAGGVERGDIILHSEWFPSGVTRIPLEKVQDLRVQNGSRWAVGLGVGAVLDAMW